MSILVVGSVAFDTLKTAYGERQKILGGAATYFSLSASHFTDVRVVGVVGEDFTPENEAVMKKRGVDCKKYCRCATLCDFAGNTNLERLSFHSFP